MAKFFLKIDKYYATVDSYSYTYTLFYMRKETNLDMYVPNSDMAPHAVHITKLKPIDPVLIKSPVGETNIPEPA